MTSITITASFLGTAAAFSQRLPLVSRRKLVITNAAGGSSEGENVKISHDSKEENSNGRRELMFAAAAATMFSVAAVAVAEPKRGTPEARKLYTPVCVTMPTAKICHK